MPDSSPRPRRSSMLVFGQPDIREPEIQEVVDTLRSGWLGTGPRTAQFEQEFAAFTGAKHAVAVNSCTAGLHLSLLALGVGPGDEVITTAMTFASTVNVILHVGATPVLVDIDPTTQNIDPELVASAVSKRTRAVIPVHMAGRPCDLDALQQIADKNQIAVVEDAAHAVEARWRDKKIGSGSNLASFSFYATKNVVTGEGGMVTTNDDELADNIRISALHGLTRDAWKRYGSDGYVPYDVILPGWKYNMMDIQAALGIHQLRRAMSNLECRNEIWRRYDDAFAGIPGVRVPSPFRDGVHARHLYTIQLDPEASGISRDRFIGEMKKRNIGTGVHFEALHLHSYFRERLGYEPGTFPHAELVGSRTVSLPLSPKLSDADVEDVIDATLDSIPAASA